MNTQPNRGKRIPYLLTEAGRKVVDTMRAKHPPLTGKPTRRERCWALTDAAIALLDGERRSG